MTTVTTVKSFTGIPAADLSKDSLLEFLINAASERIEKYCSRHFEKATYTEYHRGHERQRLLLNQYPIVSVTSVELNGSVLASTEYETEDADAGILYRETGWPWRGYSIGLVGEPGISVRNIKVVYVAGYVLPKDATEQNPRTLPYELEQACISFVAHLYGGKEGAGKLTEQQGAVRTDYEKLVRGVGTLPLPPEVAALCEGHRKLVVA